MSYTGKVTPGGPADVRELADLTITKVSVGPMDNNAYVLRCNHSGDQLLIDAANEPARLLELIGDGGLGTVITTHQHADHWQGLAEVVAGTNATPLAHRMDAGGLPIPVTAVADGDKVSLGSCELELIHISGHTPGSICILYNDPSGHPHLFTGDCLFPGGVGNTGGDPELFTSLIDNVSTKLFDRLPDDTWFYPGHGNDGTLGEQRPSLPEWRERGW